MSNTPVILSTAHGDLGIVPAGKALIAAQAVAERMNQPVTIRNAVTDKVLRMGVYGRAIVSCDGLR